MKYITIKYDEKVKTVPLKDFVSASTKMLKDFGFESVTKEEVEQQVDNILSKKPVDVIGAFLQDLFWIKDVETNGGSG